MDFTATKLADYPVIREAFDAATELHQGQLRGTSTGKNVDYIGHPVLVAQLLQQTIDNPEPELIAAGLVHDTKEDVGITYSALEDRLGSSVANLVNEVSVDNALKGHARRQFQVNIIETMSLNARRLRVGDRTANLWSLAFDPPSKWTLQNKLDYILSSEALFKKANIPDERLNKLAQEAIVLAKRSLFVAIRERVRDKGSETRSWKKASPKLKEYIANAVADLDLEKKLIGEDGIVQQKSNDLDALYTDAASAQEELRSVLTSLARFYDLRVEVPDDLKGRDRAEEVVKTRLQGNAGRINDIARASVVCRNMDEVKMALHALSQSYRIHHVYDRFNTPAITGYREMHLVMRSDESHFCEVQIHLENLWNAKKTMGDFLYHALRRICGKPKEEWTPEDGKEKKRLIGESHRLYRAAAEGYDLPTPAQTPCRPVSARSILSPVI